MKPFSSLGQQLLPAGEGGHLSKRFERKKLRLFRSLSFDRTMVKMRCTIPNLEKRTRIRTGGVYSRKLTHMTNSEVRSFLGTIVGMKPTKKEFKKAIKSFRKKQKKKEKTRGKWEEREFVVRKGVVGSIAAGKGSSEPIFEYEKIKQLVWVGI